MHVHADDLQARGVAARPQHGRGIVERHAELAGLQAGAVMSLDLTISALANAYRSGALTPAALVEKLLAERRKHAVHNIWISVVPDEALRARARDATKRTPLRGVRRPRVSDRATPS